MGNEIQGVQSGTAGESRSRSVPTATIFGNENMFKKDTAVDSSYHRQISGLSGYRLARDDARHYEGFAEDRRGFEIAANPGMAVDGGMSGARVESVGGAVARGEAQVVNGGPAYGFSTFRGDSEALARELQNASLTRVGDGAVAWGQAAVVVENRQDSYSVPPNSLVGRTQTVGGGLALTDEQLGSYREYNPGYGKLTVATSNVPKVRGNAEVIDAGIGPSTRSIFGAEPKKQITVSNYLLSDRTVGGEQIASRRYEGVVSTGQGGASGLVQRQATYDQRASNLAIPQTRASEDAFVDNRLSVGRANYNKQSFEYNEGGRISQTFKNDDAEVLPPRNSQAIASSRVVQQQGYDSKRESVEVMNGANLINSSTNFYEDALKRRGVNTSSQQNIPNYDKPVSSSNVYLKNTQAMELVPVEQIRQPKINFVVPETRVQTKTNEQYPPFSKTIADNEYNGVLDYGNQDSRFREVVDQGHPAPKSQFVAEEQQFQTGIHGSVQKSIFGREVKQFRAADFATDHNQGAHAGYLVAADQIHRANDGFTQTDSSPQRQYISDFTQTDPTPRTLQQNTALANGHFGLTASQYKVSHRSYNPIETTKIANNDYQATIKSDRFNVRQELSADKMANFRSSKNIDWQVSSNTVGLGMQGGEYGVSGRGLGVNANNQQYNIGSVGLGQSLKIGDVGTTGNIGGYQFDNKYGAVGSNIGGANVNLNVQNPNAQLNAIGSGNYGVNLPNQNYNLQSDLNVPSGKFGQNVNLNAPDLNLNAPNYAQNMNFTTTKTTINTNLPSADVRAPNVQLNGPQVDTGFGGSLKSGIGSVGTGIAAAGAGIGAGFGAIGSKLGWGSGNANANINAPKVELDVKAPSYQMNAPTINANMPNYDVSAPQLNANMPSGGMSFPKLNANLPNLDAKAPNLNVNAPKLNAELPNWDVKAPNFNANLPNYDINAPKINASVPNWDVKAPNLDIEAPKFNQNIPNYDIKATTINAPKFNANLPSMDVNAPKVNSNLPSYNANINTPNLNLPNADANLNLNAPSANFQTPNVDLKAPSANVGFGDKLKAGFSGIGTGLQNLGAKVGLGTPSAQANLPSAGVNINAPNITVTKPSFDAQAPNLNVNTPTADLNPGRLSASYGAAGNFGAPDLQANVPSANYNLSNSQIKAPNLANETPQIDINAPKLNVQRSDLYAKAPTFSGPAVSFGNPNFGANANIPSGKIGDFNTDFNQNVNLNPVSTSLKIGDVNPGFTANLPSTDYNINRPDFNIKAPNVQPGALRSAVGNEMRFNTEIPDMNAEFQKQYKADANFNASGFQTGLHGPTIDGSSVNIKTNEVFPKTNVQVTKSGIAENYNVNLSTKRADSDKLVAEMSSPVYQGGYSANANFGGVKSNFSKAQGAINADQKYQLIDGQSNLNINANAPKLNIQATPGKMIQETGKTNWQYEAPTAQIGAHNDGLQVNYSGFETSTGQTAQYTVGGWQNSQRNTQLNGQGSTQVVQNTTVTKTVQNAPQSPGFFGSLREKLFGSPSDNNIDPKTGLRQGQGKLVVPGEYTYEGNFVNGQFHGKGTMKYQDGSIYIGEFKNNRKEGHGRFYNQQGLLQKEGIWVNDQAI